MPEQSVIHSTFVIERSFPVSPEAVFAAFADPEKKRKWFSPPSHPGTEEHAMEFRNGGHERKSFQVQPGPNAPKFKCTNRTYYLDIVPNKRIVFSYSMSNEDVPFSASLATVDLIATKNGTDLIFTEQGAFFANSDGPKMREDGWKHLFDRLSQEIGALAHATQAS